MPGFSSEIFTVCGFQWHGWRLDEGCLIRQVGKFLRRKEILEYLNDHIKQEEGSRHGDEGSNKAEEGKGHTFEPCEDKEFEGFHVVGLRFAVGCWVGG